MGNSPFAGVTAITGVSDGRAARAAALAAAREGDQCLVIAPSYVRAKRLAGDLAFFSDRPVYLLPPEEDFFLKYEAKSHHDLLRRAAVLKALKTGESCIVAAPVSAVMKRLPPPGAFGEHVFSVTLGEETDPEELKARLEAMGYERTAMVETKGSFSVRGGILDVFPPDREEPVRIEFFGDQADAIRSFDPDTQRSLENLEAVRIFPAESLPRDAALFRAADERIRRAYEAAAAGAEEPRREALLRRMEQLSDFVRSGTNLQMLENYLPYFFEEKVFLWDYMSPRRLIVAEDPVRIREVMEARETQFMEHFTRLLEKGAVIPGDARVFSGWEDFRKIKENPALLLTMPFPGGAEDLGPAGRVADLESRQGPVFHGRMDLVAEQLRKYGREGYRVTIACSTEERKETLGDFLRREGLSDAVSLRLGVLTAGMEFPREKEAFLSDGDIFISRKTGRGKKKSGRKGKAIESFTDLKPGDYVVHENHGIGQFTGIRQLTVQGVGKDYLQIRYAGTDALYVPVEQMDLIQKYIGADGTPPRIHRLSGGDWKAAKARAKSAVAAMAKELIERSAARKMEKGYAFGPDTLWQREFEERFPFEETEDQKKSIEEVKRDMEAPFAMERLLCGDVGYGKTEVAARALFKCTAEGRQAAVLVPTTILASQHYHTLKERFERFPFTVEMLSRFRNEGQQAEIIRQVGNGSIDLLIGTHRMLSKDVKFKDLGLLVIDEEQRFGVAHKEAMKDLKKNVDVLSMSATPIPRTLHMSLTGIRDMSLIEEPPEERYPVQTYVLEQEDALIREAIRRELDRDGQVFVVYNRVRGIRSMAAAIRGLVPEARIGIGHGQMGEQELEDVMMSFIGGETDVLVATTIVESGIDIPNANTILILDADKMGLAQLYQLRGRVGRSNRMAFAYLLYQKNKRLTEVAEKRLKAIREFTEFGAGFKIAMKDLEIRGAGNLLGTEQHGHMVTVGYELYCKLIDDAVRALSGEIVNPDREESSIELRAAALIPETFVSDEMIKLSLYRRIASIRTAEDAEDVVDELTDRFGDIPAETLNLIRIARIKALAERLYITRIHEEPGRIVFQFAPANPLKPDRLAEAAARYGPALFVHGGTKPFLRLTRGGRDKLEEAIALLETLVV